MGRFWSTVFAQVARAAVNLGDFLGLIFEVPDFATLIPLRRVENESL